ncbi:GFA family protein [Shewanella mangrovi]|uniref:GFA family protein n=1 Tax=Shewanella mangrovi TaxID=1515746 RepID=UPI0009DF0524|nr:GFA family protein [Shewanella mangrovi]
MKGICNCGAVAFKVETKVTGLYQCHCQLCQKQSGSTSNTAVIVPASSFRWVHGLQSITHWKKDTGFTSDFCKICGSPVPNKLRDTDFYWIPMGLVSDCDVAIISHICCSSKASWDVIAQDGLHFDDMPEDLDRFISRHTQTEPSGT